LLYGPPGNPLPTIVAGFPDLGLVDKPMVGELMRQLDFDWLRRVVGSPRSGIGRVGHVLGRGFG
jgi:hypothetical protein